MLQIKKLESGYGKIALSGNKDILKEVSRERIRDEFVKILMEGSR